MESINPPLPVRAIPVFHGIFYPIFTNKYNYTFHEILCSVFLCVQFLFLRDLSSNIYSWVQSTSQQELLPHFLLSTVGIPDFLDITILLFTILFLDMSGQPVYQKQRMHFLPHPVWHLAGELLFMVNTLFLWGISNICPLVSYSIQKGSRQFSGKFSTPNDIGGYFATKNVTT